MTVGLKAITFIHNPNLPGIRASDTTTLLLEKPAPALQGWRAHLRGPSLFLVSPKGWTNGPRNQWDPEGPVTVYEIPRTNCYFQWHDVADIDALAKTGKFDSAVFGASVEKTVAPAQPRGFLQQLGETPDPPRNAAELAPHEMGDE
jgi:hypothetical protein